MAAPAKIQVQEYEGIPVFRFLDRQIYDDPTVRLVGEQIFASLPRSTDPIALILDFGGVEMVSSSLLGKLIQLQRRVDATHGQLVLCDLRPPIRDVLRTTNLETIFRIARDRREAREAFANAPG